MNLIVYLDETGDHTLEKIDNDFPIFVVTMFICDHDYYCHKVVPAVYKLKMKWFGHEAVVLHSRDIRKNEKAFSFLSDLGKKQKFYEEVDHFMSSLDYQIISTAIRKQEHKNKYGIDADNPYDLALMFALERLLPMLEDKGQSEVQIVAESRGKNEDNQLKLSFLEVINNGTFYNSRERFGKINFKLWFAPKMMNVIGTQLADLAGYPIARHVLYPSKKNPAFEVIKNKMYQGSSWINGLKIFP